MPVHLAPLHALHLDSTATPSFEMPSLADPSADHHHGAPHHGGHGGSQAHGGSHGGAGGRPEPPRGCSRRKARYAAMNAAKVRAARLAAGLDLEDDENDAPPAAPHGRTTAGPGGAGSLEGSGSLRGSWRDMTGEASDPDGGGGGGGGGGVFKLSAASGAFEGVESQGRPLVALGLKGGEVAAPEEVAGAAAAGVTAGATAGAAAGVTAGVSGRPTASVASSQQPFTPLVTCGPQNSHRHRLQSAASPVVSAGRGGGAGGSGPHGPVSVFELAPSQLRGGGGLASGLPEGRLHAAASMQGKGAAARQGAAAAAAASEGGLPHSPAPSHHHQPSPPSLRTKRVHRPATTPAMEAVVAGAALRGGFPDLHYHAYKLRMAASPLFETASTSPYWPRAGRRPDGSQRGGWQHPALHPDVGMIKLGASRLGAGGGGSGGRASMQRFRLGPSERIPHAYPFEPPWDAR